VDEVTDTVVTANVALVAPAVTLTFAGTVTTAVLLLVSVTTAPPEGAAALSVTVPVEDAPPINELGFSVTEATMTGFTVKTADWLLAL
jgi:hypothetical protein